jgi:threonyl-tRNA synthetase
VAVSEQVKVIPVSTAFDDYANEVTAKLRRRGITAKPICAMRRLGYKIREAQLEKLPYMFIVGENEMNAGSVSVRKRGEGDLGAKPVQEVIELLSQEIADRVIS